MPNVPSAWLGGSWSGWEAWSSSSFWGGKEIYLFDSDSEIKLVGWTLLGGEFERLNEINVRQFNGISELGILFEIQDAEKIGTIDAQIIDFGDAWKIRGIWMDGSLRGGKHFETCIAIWMASSCRRSLGY